MNQKIGILLHHTDQSLATKSLLIWYIVDFWEEMGFDVDVIKGIPNDQRSYDLLVAHLNLTKIPEDYIQYMAQFPNVLNLNMTDISKRNISKNLVSRNSEYTGPVIVKTDANSAGLPESILNRKKRRISIKLYKYLNYEFVRRINPTYYQVYESKGAVPRKIWKNKKLVVERFIPERQAGFYCIRICHFLGDVILNNCVYSKSKVIKGDNIDHVQKAEVPTAIHNIRKDMGFDFGKFDYVVHEGTVSILDANKTPGTVGSDELDTLVAKKLANGILHYL